MEEKGGSSLFMTTERVTQFQGITMKRPLIRGKSINSGGCLPRLPPAHQQGYDSMLRSRR